MSATTDRLVEMAAMTAPLPWPVHDFYGNLTRDQFQLVLGLTQAWPLLREEMAELEASVLSLSSQNAQLRSERCRIIAGSTAQARRIESLTASAADQAQQDHGLIARLNAETARLGAIVTALPERFVAAERVCESFTTTRQGSGGAHGFIDGHALDAWRATAR